MKIERISAIPVNVHFRQPERWSQGERSGVTSIVVTIETDGGIVGVGESVPAPTVDTTLAAIRIAEQLLIGEDPRQVEKCWQKLQVDGGMYSFAKYGNASLAGVEIACWDILGKSLNCAVHQLFGGKVREEVRFMGFIPYVDDSDAVCARATALRDDGYDTLYIKSGFGEDIDCEMIRRLRGAVGDHVSIRVDPNEAWRVDEALRIMRKVEDCDLQYVEQPVRMDRLEQMRDLRMRCRVPIAANQSSWLNGDVYDILRLGAADVVMTDPWQAGGLKRMLVAASMCAEAGIELVYHSFAPLSIGTRAAMQVLAASTACNYAHQSYHGMLGSDVVRDPVLHSAGVEAVSDSPGIGVTIDDGLLRDAHQLFLREGYLSAYGWGS